MQATIAQSRREPLLAGVGSSRALSAAAWVLGLFVPLYLAMRGGGYEGVLRDQVGIAIWWILLVGVLVGALPVTRPSRAQLIALGALVAFAAWTGVGALWSQSSGRTVEELSRLSSYAAVLALGIVTVRAGTRTALMGGVACATSLVAALALLSRLHPDWFPANETAALLRETQVRLSYPLNYWNAVATMAAIGVPLLAHFAAAARHVWLRMAAAASLPVMVTVIYLTFSRGGWVELSVAVLVLLALSAERMWLALTLSIVGGASALLIGSIRQRPAVDHGLLSSVAEHHGGNELIAVVLVVCAGVALLQGAVVLLERHVQASRALSTPTNRAVGRPPIRAALTGVAVCALVGTFLAAGGPRALSHAWATFRHAHAEPARGVSGPESHLLSISGEGRYQYWVSALHAFESKPLGGIGAGTFQFWWASHGSIYSYVINAHSLYFETLGETGAIGLGLLLVLLGAALLGTLKRARRAPSAARSRQAAIAASIAAFLAAAAVDWVWQIPAIPAAALLLTAAGLARGPGRRPGLSREEIAVWDEARPHGKAPRQRVVPSSGVRAKIGWIALAALGAAAIVVPMASDLSLRESQAQANAGRLSSALSDARGAHGVEPYAAEPALQQALVLEQAHKLIAAAEQAAKATSDAETDWQAWLVRSRIEAERGNVRAALASWSKARSLDPHDPLFAEPR